MLSNVFDSCWFWSLRIIYAVSPFFYPIILSWTRLCTFNLLAWKTDQEKGYNFAVIAILMQWSPSQFRNGWKFNKSTRYRISDGIFSTKRAHVFERNRDSGCQQISYVIHLLRYKKYDDTSLLQQAFVILVADFWGEASNLSLPGLWSFRIPARHFTFLHGKSPSIKARYFPKRN